MFDRLINDEQVKPIVSDTGSEQEISINNADLVRLGWLENMLIKGLVSPQVLIELIKERVFCLQLSNFLCKSMAELDFFFPLVTDGEYSIPPNLKRYSYSYLDVESAL